MKEPIRDRDLTTRHTMNLDLSQYSAEQIVNELSNNKVREILTLLKPRLRLDEGEMCDVTISPSGCFTLTGNKRRREETPPVEESMHVEESIRVEEVEKTHLENFAMYAVEIRAGGHGYLSETFRQQFLIAFDYAKTHGLEDINIPDSTSHTSDGITRDVGSWIKHQRVKYREGKLKPSRCEILEKCGIRWHAKEHNWDTMYELYCAYREDHLSDPPSSYVCPGGEKLGDWVSIQRKEYTRKSLSQVHCEKLNAQNITWAPRANTWMTHFHNLMEFLEGNNNVLPRRRQTCGQYGTDLAVWLGKQKEKLLSGRITIDQKNMLLKLPDTARQYLTLGDVELDDQIL